ncbi:hypothetical protein BDR05DRAFT_566830 [Suillus weaverae]|nr:hypothetical protein BDR05DRAFT_566830 [Suillus weaverae]
MRRYNKRDWKPNMTPGAPSTSGIAPATRKTIWRPVYHLRPEQTIWGFFFKKNHRSSSTGVGLRPVLLFGLDDENENNHDGPFASATSGVDEVEYAYSVLMRRLFESSSFKH